MITNSTIHQPRGRRGRGRVARRGTSQREEEEERGEEGENRSWRSCLDMTWRRVQVRQSTLSLTTTSPPTYLSKALLHHTKRPKPKFMEFPCNCLFESYYHLFTCKFHVALFRLCAWVYHVYVSKKTVLCTRGSHWSKLATLLPYSSLCACSNVRITLHRWRRHVYVDDQLGTRPRTLFLRLWTTEQTVYDPVSQCRVHIHLQEPDQELQTPHTLGECVGAQYRTRSNHQYCVYWTGRQTPTVLLINGCYVKRECWPGCSWLVCFALLTLVVVEKSYY